MTDRVSPLLRRRSTLGIAGAALLAIGGGAGALVVAQTRPSATMAPATPVAIRSLSDGIVTIRGRVAEVYGDKFVLQDASGRALVETGPRWNDATLVHAGEAVTVQGRFDNGSVHAAFLVDATGKVQALGPLAGPPAGPRDHRGDGPEDGRRDGPPPPPAATPPAATPAVPAASAAAVPPAGK